MGKFEEFTSKFLC